MATSMPNDPHTTLTRLRAWFDEAVALPAAERQAWLAAHVASEADRNAVRALLAEDEAAGFLDMPAGERIARLAAPELEAEGLIGRQVGAFRIVRALGQGGMAAVFLGERVGADFSQRVAIKLLRRGLYSPLEQRLFQRERQVLAALEHPHIARLIDGGVTEAGIPYLVMEYVDGVPITQYAREHALDLRERLRLFASVCRAVAAAHASLVVHRDLKPSNILVTIAGDPKLLDFGIAKLLEEDAPHATGTAPVFTPGYAAPEQLAGGAITTATDAYGLGVLLHELLLGERPDSLPLRRPSSRAGDAGKSILLDKYTGVQLRRLLRGDLDTIVLHALEAEPPRRYPTAAALADDIGRHLDGKPVAAHPPSRWYRAQKFVARHRAGVAATALVALALLAASGIALWQAGVARREAQRANSVRDFVVGLFDTARAHLPRDQQPTPEQLVDLAQLRLATIGLDDITRADVLSTLGEVNLSLSKYTQAENLFAQAQTLAERGGDAAAARHARVLRADALRNAGDNVVAMRQLNAELPALRASRAADLPRALAVLAEAELATGAADAALAHEREAADMVARRHGDDDLETLAARFRVGNLLTQAQRYPEAIAQLEPLLARWRANHAPEDERYTAALASLAAAADGIGDTAKSEARLRDLLALKQRIYTAPHDAIAATLRELAMIIGRDGARGAEAQTLFDQALAMQHQVFGADHAEIAETLEARGNVLVAQQRIAEAEAAYRDALAMCARAALKSEVCPRARNDLGMAYYHENRLDEAEREMQQALAERRALFGDNHPTVAYSLSTLANVAAKKKDKVRAVELSAQALAVLERGGRGASREVVMVRNNYAGALWLVDRNAEALAETERALADWQRVAPEAKPRRVMMLVLKAQILAELQRKEASRQAANEAIALDVPASLLPALTKKLLRELSGRADAYPEPAR